MTSSYDPKAIFIVPDQTKLERNEDYKLRVKLREKRQENPNDFFLFGAGRSYSDPPKLNSKQ